MVGQNGNKRLNGSRNTHESWQAGKTSFGLELGSALLVLTEADMLSHPVIWDTDDFRSQLAVFLDACQGESPFGA